MNTTNKPSLEQALVGVPEEFRKRIIEHYLAAKRALAEGKDESVGMAAGKLCESVLRLLQHNITSTYTPFNKRIDNFARQCRDLIETSNSAVPESLRVVMPRALVFVYTVRNKRGIGHVGGDVHANRIDAMTIGRVCDWVICELVRVFHGMSLEEAQDIVDALALRNAPEVWHVGGKRRVLKSSLDYKQKVLLLCHQSPESAILVEDLFDWVEYSNLSTFKQKVLKALHNDRLIEYDQESEAVTISPLGVREVEDNILGSNSAIRHQKQK
jgi:hypothetical protein